MMNYPWAVVDISWTYIIILIFMLLLPSLKFRTSKQNNRLHYLIGVMAYYHFVWNYHETRKVVEPPSSVFLIVVVIRMFQGFQGLGLRLPLSRGRRELHDLDHHVQSLSTSCLSHFGLVRPLRLSFCPGWSLLKDLHWFQLPSPRRT